MDSWRHKMDGWIDRQRPGNKREAEIGRNGKRNRQMNGESHREEERNRYLYIYTVYIYICYKEPSMRWMDRLIDRQTDR